MDVKRAGEDRLDAYKREGRREREGGEGKGRYLSAQKGE